MKRVFLPLLFWFIFYNNNRLGCSWFLQKELKSIYKDYFQYRQNNKN